MISLLKVINEQAEFVFREQDFSSFKYFYRKTAREFATMGTRECAIKVASMDLPDRFMKFVDNGQDHLEEGDKMLLYVFKICPELIYVIITSGEYSVSVCKRMSLELAQMTVENLDSQQEAARNLATTFIEKYQKHTNYDGLSKVQSELDELKEIMVQNIETVLKRGEQLDDLVAKSADLSTKSKQFYKASKKVNSCCTII